MRNFQLGQTIINTLCVIAITSVLTMGTISGFSWIYKRVLAVKTVNDVNVAIMSVAERLGRGELLISEISFIGDSGYGFTSSPVDVREANGDWTQSIEIKVEDVPADVCEYLLKQDWGGGYKNICWRNVI